MKESSSRPPSGVGNTNNSMRQSRSTNLPATGTTDRVVRGRMKRQFTCNWNSACKALILGLILMFIGGCMATVGYFVDHMYTAHSITGNDTVIAREKSRLNVNSVSTYVGPMIMGVGGFIVVAACVMTFEQRDNAAKIVPNRLQLSSTSTHIHSITRYNKPSPGSRPPPPSFREGSGRRQYVSPYSTDVATAADPFYGRRDLTTDFIQFSRNLQQASLKKKYQLMDKTLTRCPSAPDLAVIDTSILPKTASGFPKIPAGRSSLHPILGGGYSSFLSPRLLQRQAVSVDNPVYYPNRKNLSLPGSKHVSRQGSTSTGGGGGGKGSLESLERRKSRLSHPLDLQLQLETVVAARDLHVGRIKNRNKRSDTARRHLLLRQAQVEYEDEFCCYEREHKGGSSTSGSPHLNYCCSNFEHRFQSSSTPHSRRESISSRIPSRSNRNCPFKGSSPTQQNRGKRKYSRSNTISNEMNYYYYSRPRRDSSTSTGGDFHLESRRKGSNTSDCSSNQCCSRNIDDLVRKDSKSPTSSLKLFQENQYSITSTNATSKEHKKLGHNINSVGTDSSGSSRSRSGSCRQIVQDRSLSPDSIISASSSATEGHSKAEHISIELEESEV